MIELAIGVLCVDVLIAYWVVLEYRRYRFRKTLRAMERISELIGEAFIPAVQDMAYAVNEVARRLDELRDRDAPG